MWTAILTFLPMVWGPVKRVISLATSPAGIALCCLLLGYYVGQRNADSKAEIAALQAQIMTLQHDNDTIAESKKLADEQAESLALEATKNLERVNALNAALAKRAPERRSCALTDDDARRLRSIR